MISELDIERQKENIKQSMRKANLSNNWNLYHWCREYISALDWVKGKVSKVGTE